MICHLVFWTWGSLLPLNGNIPRITRYKLRWHINKFICLLIKLNFYLKIAMWKIEMSWIVLLLCGFGHKLWRIFATTEIPCRLTSQTHKILFEFWSFDCVRHYVIWQMSPSPPTVRRLHVPVNLYNLLIAVIFEFLNRRRRISVRHRAFPPPCTWH